VPQPQPELHQESSTPPLYCLTARDVRLLRQVRGLTQGEVAKRAGFSVSKLSGLESGKEPITPDYEVRLIRVLWP